MLNPTEEAAEGLEDASAPITCPLVLQCGQCRTIVGDSCTVLALDPVLRTITLEKRGENAVLQDELHTSQSGADYGSTYHLLQCRKCAAPLGRMYRTTPPELDLWRGHYTFSSDALSFYELSGEFPRPAEAAKAAPEGTTAEPSLEIIKLQKFCLYLYDRIQQLEGQLKGTERPNETVREERRPPGRPRKERAPSPEHHAAAGAAQ